MVQSKEREIDLIRVTADGVGVGFDTNGKIVFVQGVKPDDEVVKVVYVEELTTCIIAKRVGIVAGKQRSSDTDEKDDEEGGAPYKLGKNLTDDELEEEDYYETDEEEGDDEEDDR